MIAFLLGRHEILPHAFTTRYPELRDIHARRGGLPPRIAGWCLGQRTVAAVTLWRTVWLGDRIVVDDALLLHEWRHVAQFGATWAFPILYLWESLRRGYWNNRFEVDARRYAADRIRETTHAEMDR